MASESPKRGRRKIEARRGAHKWTSNKRRFVHLVFTELVLSKDDLVSLMHACFPDMMQVNYNGNWKKFSDIWNGRNHISHPPDWVEIARPRPAIDGKRQANNTPYTPAELAEFARIRGVVHQTATANHIPIVLKTPLNVELWPVGAVVPPVPQQWFPQAHTSISKPPSLGQRLNEKVIGSAKKTILQQPKRKHTAAQAGSRKRKQPARTTRHTERYEDSDEEDEGLSEEEEQEVEENIQVVHPKRKSGNTAKKRNPQQLQRKIATSPRHSRRTLRRVSAVYGETIDESGEEGLGEEGIDEEEVEDEAEAEVDRSNQQVREPELEEEEQRKHLYYDAPISDNGYKLAEIAVTRFRGAKAVRQRRPTTPPTALDMVHQGSLSTVQLRNASNVVSALTHERFNQVSRRIMSVGDTDKDAYFLGGAVLRVYYPVTHDTPAHFADTMICDVTQCDDMACQGINKPYTFTAMTKSGKPFVHSEDCATDEKGTLEFFPDHVNGPTAATINPAYIQEENFIFHNGFERMIVAALVCSEGDCRRCERRRTEREGYQVDGEEENADLAEREEDAADEEGEAVSGGTQHDSLFERSDDQAISAGDKENGVESEEDAEAYFTEDGTFQEHGSPEAGSETQEIARPRPQVRRRAMPPASSFGQNVLGGRAWVGLAQWLAANEAE